MLKFWNVRTMPGVDKSQYLVYQDDQNAHAFYVMPNRPTLGMTEQGKLSFLFRKYRFSADPARNDAEREARKNKGLGGGFVVFDVVLNVPQASHSAIHEKLRSDYK